MSATLMPMQSLTIARLLQAGSFMLLLAATGCTTTNFEQIREAETGISSGEKIAVFGRQNQLGYEAKASMVRCLTRKTKKIPIVTQEQFADSMFPWFEPRLAPTSLDDLKLLLKRPAVASKLAETQVRYLVWVSSAGNATERKGGMSCAIGLGVGYCLGFMMWDNDASYEVSIWDLKTLTQSGRMRSSSAGTSAVLGAILPIPFIAPVERQSCHLAAKNLSAFILNDDKDGQ